MHGKLKHYLKNEDGAVTAEFALVMPVVTLLIAVIAVFLSWAILALKVDSAVNTISREAIVMKNPSSEEHQQQFREELKHFLSVKDAEAATLTIEESEETVGSGKAAAKVGWVKVKLSVPCKSGPLGIFIKQVENEVVGRME